MARRIIVTGAGGFVGRHLLPLLADDQVVAIDQSVDSVPSFLHLTLIQGDFCQPEVLQQAFADGCDAVIHLATVPGGAAEQNPELAWQVNVEGTRALAQAAIDAGDCPRFVFASSIAVLGEGLTETVTDQTPPRPTLLYGAHKLMMEDWLAALSRRGQLDAVSLRLSAVVARPRSPSGMKSAFMSNVFHDLLASDDCTLPVSASATCWMTSVRSASGAFVRALEIDGRNLPASRALTLPTLRVQMDELVAAIASRCQQQPPAVTYQVNAELEAAFGCYPAIKTAVANELDFVSESSLDTLVRNVISSIHSH